MLRRSFIGFIKGLGLGRWVIYVYFPPMIEVRAEGSFFSKPLKRGFGLGMWPMPGSRLLLFMQAWMTGPLQG